MRSFHLFSAHHVTHGDKWSMSDYSAQVNIVVLHCIVNSKRFSCTCELQAGPLWARTKVDTFFQVGRPPLWCESLSGKRQKVVAFGKRGLVFVA